MDNLLQQYKENGVSNFDTLKGEIQNMLEELNDVNRTKVDRHFCNDVLSHIKQIRLSIMGITD